jgi:hypothetical protein
MADKHKNRIDLLLPSAKKCKRFGKRDGILIPLEEPNRLADPSHDTQAWKRKT